MRIALIIFLVMLINTPVFADEFFADREINEVRVVEVDSEQGTAWIRDRDGNEAEVCLGDTIGIDRRSVIKIDDGSITVQLGNELTKMPAYDFEKIQMFEREPSDPHPPLPTE